MPIGDLLAQITGESTSGQAQINYHERTPKEHRSEGQTRRLVNTSNGTSTMTGSTPRISNSTSKSTNLNSSLSRIKLDRNTSSGDNKKLLASSNHHPTTPITPNGQQKPPKKGSYAEIMARGKAAHAILGQVGRITHKDIERPRTKREREEIRAQRVQKKQKTLSVNKSFPKLEQRKERDVGQVKPEPPKKIKKAALATTGYTGTARPKPNAKSGNSRSLNSNSSGIIRNEGRMSLKSGYKNMSEDDEDDEEDYDDEEQDYESDLSDMEAATFEVDEEEELATKIARREDAEALAEENRLKRQKEEKRKKLAAMAKSRTDRRY